MGAGRLTWATGIPLVVEGRVESTEPSVACAATARPVIRETLGWGLDRNLGRMLDRDLAFMSIGLTLICALTGLVLTWRLRRGLAMARAPRKDAATSRAP